VKTLKKKVSQNLVLYASLPGFFIIVLAGTSQLSAGRQVQQDSVTIQNETYQFEVTVPKNWTFRKVVQPDPDEGMRTGEASFSISIGGSDEEPENWNGIVFNSNGSSGNPQPFVSIYAHRKPDQEPEEFAELFESTVAGYGGKMLKVNKEFSVGDANGFDYNYNLFIQNRYVALYKNGIRVVIHYFFPDSDTTLFGKHASEVESVIQSLRIE